MNLSLQPFFCYYGGKYRGAPLYPRPQHTTLIEPFAGGAGYACRYPLRKVKLYDLDECICGVWDYLIHVPSSEVRKLPIVNDLDKTTGLTQEAKWLIGYWLHKATTRPAVRCSSWANGSVKKNSGWCEGVRERIASQVEKIRHWTIDRCSYTAIPDNANATWFIDPPYANSAGRAYRHNLIDYKNLAQWCRSRSGQVIVCEGKEADWLPFKVLTDVRYNQKDEPTQELIWLNATTTDKRG